MCIRDRYQRRVHGERDLIVMDITDTVREEEYFVLIDNRGERRIVNIKNTKTIKWRKKLIKLDQLKGKRYDSVYDLDKEGNLAEVVTKEGVDPMGVPDLSDDNEEEGKSEEEPEETRDNRNFFAENKAQKLTNEEIKGLKAKGVEGENIIQEIAKNNQNFEAKTSFSQRKYLKKKMQRHLHRFRIVRTSIANIAETLFVDDASSVNFLRWDSLGVVLHKSNVALSREILVIDNASGVLLGGALSRSSPTANLTCGYFDDKKPAINKYRALNFLNLPRSQTERVKFVSFEALCYGEGEPQPRFDSVMISTDFEVSKVISKIVPLILPSGSLVVYSPFLEVLGEGFDYLTKEKRFVFVMLNDIFMRELQVLKLRTHPLMNMHAFSGFILSGIKVV
eukprot:TRINITY_DN679_c0_g1_i4.p1 TRINITY_DN679_c0_g1~~TRINITY_DN679_c0_g1_i4.p1  ORF type:complete len:409 (+),score=124.57 TRINITY_DN679_c0_g1_i4:49-1227(+)